MKWYKQHGFFIAVFLLSTVLRFIPLFQYQFTYDELSGLDRTQFSNLSDLLDKGVKIDAHPALIQLIIYWLSQTFGYVNWIIKLPFLLMGQASILYAYLFGCRYFSRQAGNVSALILAFSLIFVFYAPIARMYIAGVFFSIALLYYFFAIAFSSETRTRDYVLLCSCALLSAYNHHINALFALTVCVSGLWLISKEKRKLFLITAAVTVLCYLPHLSITLYQMSVPGIGADSGGWLSPPKWSALLDFIQVLFGTGYSVWLFVIIAIVVFINVNEVQMKQQRYLVLLFLFNFAVVFFYSLWRSPIFQYSVMLFAGTALVLAVAALCDVQELRKNQLVLLLTTATLLYQTYVRKDYLHQAVETVFEYQFSQTKKYKDRFGDQQVYPLFFDCDTLMRNIYFKKYHSHFDFKMGQDSIIVFGSRQYYQRPGHAASMVQDSLVSSIHLFSEFIRGLKCNYIALSSAPPLYQAIVKDEFPYLIENTQTQAVNYKLYSKLPAAAVSDDAVLYECSHEKPAASDFGTTKFPLQVDSVNEFPFKVTTDYDQAVLHEGQFVVVRAKLKLPHATYNALECVLSVTDRKDESPQSYSAKSAGDYLLTSDSCVTLYSDHYIGVTHSQVKGHSNLNAFIWNRGKERFQLKTFELKVIDYWPQKWQWWN